MKVLLISLVSVAIAAQQSCPGAGAQYEPTIVADGFSTYVLANRLSSPRGMVFDKEGNLLVVEQFKGVTAFKLNDENGCVTVASKTTVVNDPSANHGIQLSQDGNQLFLSSSESVWSLPYSAKDTKVTGTYSTWITGMNQLGHISRTLLMSKKAPGVMLVSRGSGPNIDPLARDMNSGVSQIRAFNVSGPPKSIKYTQGKVIAWGLRNSIGLGENPADGGIWSNENSSDMMKRQGKDIHETSPGEEVNYHGDLTGKSELHGKNYGYPECAAAWEVSVLPQNEQITVGRHFTHGDTAATVDDSACEKNYIAPRLTLPSHWAPIDIEFNSKGTVAYMTAHGSWNKDKADGYKLFAITFANGQPTHPPTSRTAAIPLVTLRNMRTCGMLSKCFRPTGLVFDSKGRLYMASDSTGEIYVITRTDGRSIDSLTAEDLEKLARK